jgi:hypothetical protein
VANVTTATCVRPFGLPFSQAWQAAGRSGSPRANDKLNAADLARIAELNAGQRTMEFSAAWQPGNRRVDDGTWWAPVKPGTNNSPNGYLEQYNPDVTRCGDESLTVGDDARALNGGRTERDTHDGFTMLCGTGGAQCGAGGTVVRASWVSTGQGNGNDAEVRMLSQVRILCYFGSEYPANEGPRTAMPASNCPATNYQGREAGTVIVEMLPPTPAPPSPGDRYGNTAGGIQRLVLVQ